MTTITANDLKRRGISSIAAILDQDKEVTISVHGKSQYVVLDIEHYRYLRECELEAALLEVQKDREAGKITDKTVADHIASLKNE